MAVGRRRVTVSASALVVVALVGALAYVRFADALPLQTLATASPTPLNVATASPSPRPTASALVSAAPTSVRATTTFAVPAGAIATITIPRIGIQGAPIYDRGLDSKRMMLIAPGYAVTHYSFSSGIGVGNAVLYGHDDIQGNVFGHLYDLATGDTIQINVGGATQIYRVTGHQIVTPDTVSVLNPSGDVRLTIITCWPFMVDTKRWIVTAVPA